MTYNNISLERLVRDLEPRKNMFKDRGNGIYLSDQQVEILKKYHFFYDQYSDLKSFIFDIQNYLNENYQMDLEDLESVICSLSEFDYYQNIGK